MSLFIVSPGLKRWRQFLLISCVILTLMATSVTLASGPSDGLRLLHADEWGLTVEWSANTWQTFTMQRDGQSYHRVTAQGLFPMSSPGCPDLAGRGLLLAVPHHGSLTLEILTDDYTDQTGYRLTRAPKYTVTAGDVVAGEKVKVEEMFAPSPALCSGNVFYPPQPARVEVLGVLRGRRVARLTLQPMQYRSTDGGLRLHHWLVVRVRFSQPLTYADRSPDPFYEPLWRQILTNYASLFATSHLSPVAAPPLSLVPYPLSLVTPTLKIFVEEDGLYGITYDDLRGAGFDPTGLDPNTLHLTNQSQEVPIHIQNDTLLFYGQAATSTFTNRNVYWLTVGNPDGLRMAERNVTANGSLPSPTTFTNTLNLEENHTYWQNPPGGQSWDHWYWHKLIAPATVTMTFTLSRGGVTPPPQNARLQVALQGKTATTVYPDHHTRLWLNGTLLDDAWWDAQSAYQPSIFFPQSLLRDGANTLTIASPGDTGAAADQVYLNWLRLDYSDTYVAEDDRLAFSSSFSETVRFELTGFTRPQVEVYDVTSPSAPVRLLSPTIQTDVGAKSPRPYYRVVFTDTTTADQRYLALTSDRRWQPAGFALDTPSSLRSPANAADYLIITHSDFYTAVLPLATHYQSQGLRVAVVDIADVFDEFNAGIFSPAAIRDFLAYAYQHWTPPPPGYVLLVGDANLDFKDYYGAGPINYVPTHIFDSEIGETPGDNWFVAVDGADPLPDMFIGRLPVRTSDETSRAVQKILNYAAAASSRIERNGAVGAGSPRPYTTWRNRALFVADDDLSDFAALNRSLQTPLPSDVAAWLLEAQSYPPGNLTQEVVDHINQGVLLFHYTGHSAVDHWGTWSGGYIFSNAQVASLTNASGLPFATSADCISGFFALPGQAQSLAETLLARQGGGAIAVWSPTGLGYTTGHQVLFPALYQALFTGTPISVGAATTAAKIAAFAQSETWGDLVETYMLFGDPALRLNYRPSSFPLYLPIIVR